MNNQMSPAAIVERMIEFDAFSQWLGIEVLETGLGYSKIQMTVRPEMVNGFRIAHGGITFSFADSAFAFASNSRGKHAVSVDTSINHLAAVKIGDILIAEAEELDVGRRLAHYQVTVYRGEGEKVALFKGMVYRKDQLWEAD